MNRNQFAGRGIGKSGHGPDQSPQTLHCHNRRTFGSNVDPTADLGRSLLEQLSNHLFALPLRIDLATERMSVSDNLVEANQYTYAVS